MKKRFISLVTVCALMLFAIITIGAHTDKQEYTADALNSLGLFLGTDKGYELDKSLTRAEGVTLIVRMYGKVDEATENADKYNIPFTDLVGWERGYVGYAYENNITKGISADKFAPTSELTDYMFLTFTLRALGYTDLGENAQFVWDNPYLLAKEVGLIDIAKSDAEFTRADAVSIFWNALEAELVGQGKTLAQSLIAQGVFKAEDYEKAIDISDDGKAEDTTDAPETDAPETDAPETDAPETDAPETDAPETDAPETDLIEDERDPDEGSTDWS